MEEKYMKEALKQAKKAYDKQEVPVGCVIVKDNKIIARAYNQREMKKDVTMHAEITAIRKACKKLNTWRLNDCEIYITLKPCNMCAGAIMQSRIKKIYIGTMDNNLDINKSISDTFGNYATENDVEIKTGILEDNCKKILKDFFRELRILKK